MLIDEMQSTAQLRQFASQVVHLSPEEIAQFESMWDGGRDDGFYLGLVGGLAVATTMSEKCPEYIPRITAFVAGKLDERRSSEKGSRWSRVVARIARAVKKR